MLATPEAEAVADTVEMGIVRPAVESAGSDSDTNSGNARQREIERNPVMWLAVEAQRLMRKLEPNAFADRLALVIWLPFELRFAFP